MEPSLVIWPIISTGTFVSLAYLSSIAAHSRTWLTLPGEDSIRSEYKVWIESITTSSGAVSVNCVMMFSSEVSLRIMHCSLWTPRRSARILICSGLSSPDTYRIGVSASRTAICKAKVDFPIPGSPPSSTSDPGTRPPPRTRLTS